MFFSNAKIAFAFFRIEEKRQKIWSAKWIVNTLYELEVWTFIISYLSAYVREQNCFLHYIILI